MLDFFKKKNISMEDEIKRVITARILLSFFILFTALILLSVLNVTSTFRQLEKNVEEQCAILSEFTIGQLLINNESAIQLNIDNINRENNLIHFEWVRKGKPPLQNKMTWILPFSWVDYCPIQSKEGEYFGYFKVSGSLIYNYDMLSAFLIKMALVLCFIFTIFLLLYPLGKRIPEEIFVKPIMDLLNLLKSGKKEQSVSDESKIPVEIQEIKLKLTQMLKEAESHSHEVAFGQIAAKVAHDIRSPLAALNMLLKKNVASLPEEERNIIRSATQRINDIANNLLNQKKEKDLGKTSFSKKTAPELAAILLENIVSEKRAQYSERDIQFQLNIDENVHGVFVDVNANELSRALSNLINNSVEAIPENRKEKGKVVLGLTVTSNQTVLFSVMDNGIGMHPEQLAQILEKSVSVGKENGSGIGLSSAIQSIESWNGIFSIKSQFGTGTQVDFALPIAVHPEWFAPILPLQEGSTIVFLDDDEVIHQIWQKRLSETKDKKQKDFHRVHCYRAEELLKWYQENPLLREKALFLVDYELIGSSSTGSDIVKQLNIANHALMVTSRYDDANVRLECQQLGIKFIPKNFAVHIPIYIFSSEPDFIFVDDSVYLTDAWKAQAELHGKKVVIFNTVNEVNTYIEYFPHNTPLYIDSNLGEDIKGEILAKSLHEKGFQTIYLCTGMDDTEFPDMPWIKKIIGKEYPESLM